MIRGAFQEKLEKIRNKLIELIGKYFIFKNFMGEYKYIGQIKKIEIKESSFSPPILILYGSFNREYRCFLHGYKIEEILNDNYKWAIFDTDSDAELFMEMKMT